MSGVCVGRAADKPEAKHPARLGPKFEVVGLRLRDVDRRQIVREPGLEERLEGRPPQVGGIAGNEDAAVRSFRRVHRRARPIVNSSCWPVKPLIVSGPKNYVLKRLNTTAHFHWAWMFPSLTTRPHLAISVLMYSANCSGVISTVAAPSRSKAACRSGDFKASCDAA